MFDIISRSIQLQNILHFRPLSYNNFRLSYILFYFITLHTIMRYLVLTSDLKSYAKHAVDFLMISYDHSAYRHLLGKDFTVSQPLHQLCVGSVYNNCSIFPLVGACTAILHT